LKAVSFIWPFHVLFTYIWGGTGRTVHFAEETGAFTFERDFSQVSNYSPAFNFSAI
jgi:hypothetical protein